MTTPAPPAFPRRTPRPGDPYLDAPHLPGALDSPVDVAALFADFSPRSHLELEVGGGRGTFAFERLTHALEVCLLGLEVNRKWATLVDRKLATLGLASRGRVFAEDARLALPRLRPSGSIRAVFLHFPDPWWKKRHEKRLVLGDVVQNEFERLLAPGGALFVQTDVEHRALQYRTFLDRRAALVPAGDTAGDPTLLENPFGARSPREKRAIADGLPIHRLRYVKR